MPIVSCIEDHPTAKTVQFGGKYISLRKLARETGIDHGYLSRMFSSSNTRPRLPERMSLGTAMRCSACLGMTIDEFIDALYDQQARRQTNLTKLQLWHDYMDTRETAERTKAARRGLPAPPSIPLGATAP